MSRLHKFLITLDVETDDGCKCPTAKEVLGGLMEALESGIDYSDGFEDSTVTASATPCPS